MRPEVPRNAAWSVAEAAANGLVLFATLTLLLRWLGTEGVGLWSLVASLTAVGRLADLGVSTALVRFVAHARPDGGDRSAVVAQTGLIAVGVLYLVVLAAAAAPLSWAVAALLDGPAAEAGAALVPLACVSLWLNAVSLAACGALVGARRADRKSAVVVAGGLVQLAGVALLVPSLGVAGALWAQIAQGAFAAAAAWALLRRELPGLPPVPQRFSASEFRAMLRFALPLQLTTFAMLGFEPAVRAILVVFGGLHDVGLYEVASRVVQQARLLVATPNQILMPAFAELQRQDSRKVDELYSRALDLTVLISPILILSTVTLSPIVSVVFLGYSDKRLVCIVSLLAAGWTINSFAAPAYFIGLGTGFIGANIVGHLVTSFGAVAFGWIFGLAGAGIGVVAGTALGIVSGSLVIFIGNHRRTNVSVFEAIGRSTLAAMLAAILMTVLIVTVFMEVEPAIGEIWAGIISGVIYFFVSGMILLKHPLVKSLIRRYFV